MKTYSLYYWDKRLPEDEVVQLLELAWEELYELEFDQVFGAWRGVHYDPETDTVHITWETMYGGPPLMLSINRTTHAIRGDYPTEEMIAREEAEIERVRSLPAGHREKSDSRVKAQKSKKESS